MTYAYLYSVQTKKQVWKNEYKVKLKLESQNSVLDFAEYHISRC